MIFEFGEEESRWRTTDVDARIKPCRGVEWSEAEESVCMYAYACKWLSVRMFMCKRKTDGTR